MRKQLAVIIVIFISSSLDAGTTCGHHAMYGVPTLGDQVICRSGYLAGYSYEHMNPAYIMYYLNSVTTHSNQATRRGNGSEYKADTEIPSQYRVREGDYFGTGFDRGHLLSAASSDSTLLALRQSFLMTNIVPMNPKLNRHGAWRSLEDVERGLVSKGSSGQLIVVSGPMYGYTLGLPRLPNGTAVPSHFFKIMVELNSGIAHAYIIPNDGSALVHHPYRVAVDEIESRINADLFALLPDDIERSLESYKGLTSDI
ncbi:MAG: DNA/RNA non-specific endonuclease [Pseudomonadales bacterium]